MIVQSRPKDVNVIEYESFINMALDSILQLTFMKLPSVEFWCSNQRRIFTII